MRASAQSALCDAQKIHLALAHYTKFSDPSVLQDDYPDFKQAHLKEIQNEKFKSFSATHGAVTGFDIYFGCFGLRRWWWK